MAGAKETPRQKLISLMYLVFITMLALNVSKEVLDGFGQMFEKITDANERVLESNNLLLENIIVNAEEKGGKWIGHKRTAEQIKQESDAFYNEIEGLKSFKMSFLIYQSSIYLKFLKTSFNILAQNEKKYIPKMTIYRGKNADYIKEYLAT